MIKFVEIDNSVEYMENQYDSSMHALIEGAILAVFVVFLFLRDMRATLISAVAIPLSAIPAFWFMDLLGISLNFMSTMAMSLVAAVLEVGGIHAAHQRGHLAEVPRLRVGRRAPQHRGLPVDPPVRNLLGQRERESVGVGRRSEPDGHDAPPCDDDPIVDGVEQVGFLRRHLGRPPRR